MNIFSIIKNLYTNQKCDWINDIEDTEIQPYVIQRWLAMNDRVRVQTRWLDKYVFVLKPKMYLSLAWSILPKSQKMPFVKYIKKADETEEFDFILSKVRKQFKMSDNDFRHNRNRIVNEIKKNMVEWFCYYGIQKKFWKKYYLDFRLIKQYGVCEAQPSEGLAKWGI